MAVWQSKSLPGRDMIDCAAKLMQMSLAAGNACCRVPQSAGGAGLHGQAHLSKDMLAAVRCAPSRWAGLYLSQKLHHAGAMACCSFRIQQLAVQEGFVAGGSSLTRLSKRMLAAAVPDAIVRADAGCCRVPSASRRAGLCSSTQHSRHR